MADTLFASCVLPGCHTPVALVGDVCDGCVEAFGPMLKHDPGGRRMTAEEIAERDRSVHNVYAWRRMTGRAVADHA
ncbi:hypothetical protein ACWEKR_05975 [Nocardia sp. NPDC004573]